MSPPERSPRVARLKMLLSNTFLATIAIVTTIVNGALTRVTNFGLNPTNLQMNINVPAKLAQKPAIILAVSRIIT
jgi:acetylxylan esterase